MNRLGLFCLLLVHPYVIGDDTPCDAEPHIMTTTAGVEFVRTPAACFKNLPDFDYQPQYLEIDGLRQGYVDEGPADADPILLLHGQPSWSYLYRKMIPVLVAGGHRVIAMDHLGMGFSDKPININHYSYPLHADRLYRLITGLGLKNITLFCQDWGSLIGLKVAGEHPERFARIVVGNGSLPLIPADQQPYPHVVDPDVINHDLMSSFTQIPAQQPPFYDENGDLRLNGEQDFYGWMTYAMTAASFHPAEVLEAMTYFDLSPEEEAAYNAPYPSRIYLTGPRVFPSQINTVPGTTQTAWLGLRSYQKPFLTIWGGNDPGNLGRPETQAALIEAVPGAAGQPHDRLPEASHFLQDDQGHEIAIRINSFIADNPVGQPQSGTARVHTSDIPLDAWLPQPFLTDCSAGPANDLPNFSGLWREVNSDKISGRPRPPHLERIEQCGNRVVITGAGMVHDFIADGTLENGINDYDVTRRQALNIAATYEDNRLILHAYNDFKITRELDGDLLLLKAGPFHVMRMERVNGGGNPDDGVVTADEIPIAHTPPGGLGGVMPAPILAECTQPLAPGAADLRGTWEAHSGNIGHVERIEQCDDRVVITGAKVIHDMRADGTVENGVNDVSGRDLTTPVHVAASFENGVLVLRPFGQDNPDWRVVRFLDGEELVWIIQGTESRMHRID